MKTILYREESYAIMGAAFEVYNTLGSGLPESVYHECLSIEFIAREIPFRSEEDINVYYKKRKISKKFRADFVCYDKIILELKAVSFLNDEHRGQILSYLRASKYEVGILMNFGQVKELRYERFLI